MTWDNIVLHYLMPALIVFDWMITPPKLRISFWRGLIWLVYPFAYVAYSLIRGNSVDWYPYPFLDPGHRGYDGRVPVEHRHRDHGGRARLRADDVHGAGVAVRARARAGRRLRMAPP